MKPLNSPHPGSILAFEGIDGAGKSTLVQHLARVLRAIGVDHQVFTFPDPNGPLRDVIIAALADPTFQPHALQALFAADRLRCLPAILSLNQAGCHLLLDRYRWSSYVYGIAQGLSREWCLNLESPLPSPDLTFLLDIDPRLSMIRSEAADCLETNAALLAHCRRTYCELVDTEPGWVYIDASQSFDLVFSEAKRILEKRLGVTLSE